MGLGRLQQKLILILLIAILGSFAPMAPLRVQPPELSASTNATPPESATPPATPPAPPDSAIPPPTFDPATTPEITNEPNQAQILLAPWGAVVGADGEESGNDRIWHYHDDV